MAPAHQEQVEAIVQDAGVPNDKDMAAALAKASAVASTWTVEIYKLHLIAHIRRT